MKGNAWLVSLMIFFNLGAGPCKSIRLFFPSYRIQSFSETVGAIGLVAGVEFLHVSKLGAQGHVLDTDLSP